MASLNTNEKITCASLEDARIKSDKISNGLIIFKNDNYLIVNYKTYNDLKALGYNQIR